MKKVLIVLAGLVVLVIAALGIAILTFDINTYRPQITDVLGKQMGRAVTLGGPLKLDLSWHGVALSVQDAAIANPSWASRPVMAGIGRFQLGLALMPLFSHQISVTDLQIENADILLESASGDRHNWVIQPAAQTGAPATVAGAGAQKAKIESGPAVSIRVEHVSVKNSQVAVRGEDGKITAFKTESLTLGHEAGGLAIHFKGDYNGQPIVLNITTDADDFMSQATHSLVADLTYAAFKMQAKGKASFGDKKASIDTFALTAGKSDLHGAIAANWAGARPAISGRLVSDRLAPEDFKMPEAKGNGGASSAGSGPRRAFSDAPLGFDALKSADANLDVTIATMPLGATSLKQIDVKLALNNGKLYLSPIRASLGGGTVAGQINIDGNAAPAHLGMTFNASGVNMSDMLEVWGAEAFLSAKVDADMNIVSSGDSAHALASNVSGSFNIIGAGGDVISSAANRISSGFAEIFSPGSRGGNEGVNCLVARFTASGGLVRDNGILIDTSATTISGQGGFDLRNETINLMLRPKTKLVDVGGLLPPLHIGGTFLNPSYSLNAQAMLQNVAGLLTGGSLNDGVPTIAAAQGQNACLYTLNHPTAAAAAAPQGGVVQGLAGKAGQATQKINELGGQLMKGLLGQ